MRPLVHGLVSLATLAACSGGSMSTSATETDAATSTTMSSAAVGTEGMSSTITTTTTTGPETSSTSDGCALVCPLDAPAPQPRHCDPFVQDCPEGQKCNVWAEGGDDPGDYKCVPLDPAPDQVGEPCTVVDGEHSGLDSCVTSSVCWFVNPETRAGVCVALCFGSQRQCVSDPESCCPEGSTCTIDSGGLTLCQERCDPLAQGCTREGDACYPAGNDFLCVHDVSGDMGAVGDPCAVINACDPGTFCGDPFVYPGCDPDAVGCCVPFCPLDMPECAEGTECLPWSEGDENIGACVIPR